MYLISFKDSKFENDLKGQSHRFITKEIEEHIIST